MAELISREDVKKAIFYNLEINIEGRKGISSYESDIINIIKGLMSCQEDKFKAIPSVEAVEKPKIDKAIEEIIKYRDDEKNDFYEVEVGAINGVLEILKRNIGA